VPATISAHRLERLIFRRMPSGHRSPPERLHHPAHCRMLPVLDLNPMRRPASLIGRSRRFDTNLSRRSASAIFTRKRHCAWLDHACLATVDMPRNLADERSDRRKLLKIAGGCTIICALDSASLGSRRGMPEASRSGLDLSPQPINSAASYVPTACGCCASSLSGCRGSL
jgi:hypothetical protein